MLGSFGAPEWLARLLSGSIGPVQGGMTLVGVSAVVVTLFAALAERRRLKRRDLDAVGFVPWTLVTILGTITALFAFALALKFGG